MNREREGVYKKYVRPVLGHLDSETWHINAREALHVMEMTPFTLNLVEKFAEQNKRFKDKRLTVVLEGIEFENPVMVGAGWDKEARCVKGLYALGFSGVEVGSVLSYAQEGNPKPRQFMLSEGVALNRLGFNTPKGGLEEVRRNLEKYRGCNIPVGVSIGKNKEVSAKDAPREYARVANSLYSNASYFAINVSSPNTPGLKFLQDKKPLTDIVGAINNAMDELGKRKPLFIKISPDLSDFALDEVIGVVLDNGAAGIIASNTTAAGQIKAKYGKTWESQEGGLSGDDEDYRRIVDGQISRIYRQTQGKMGIIGSGGVKDADTALRKIRAGANVVQVVTAIRSEGPYVAGRINRGIVDWMERLGVKDIGSIRGIG